MTVKKICGIETEYGIVHQGQEDFNPSYSSSILINSYLMSQKSVSGAIPRWDFIDERPGNDARGFTSGDISRQYTQQATQPATRNHMRSHMHLDAQHDIYQQFANAILPNGARYYVDHAHPEMSSPECVDALEAVRYDCAADEILRQSMRHAETVLPEGETILIYKNNSDGKGNSYGCHENYLMDRNIPFTQIAQSIMPHFVTRQIYCGAGKVGMESTTEDVFVDGFQISSRADFIEEQIGLETTIKRPIINTRDEPHSDYQRFRRLHVIVGDANMSQVATLLKVGTTAFVLAMIEEDFMPDEIAFANPVMALHNIAADVKLTSTQQMSDGTRASALDIQWELFELSRKFSEAGGLEFVGESSGEMVLERWEQVLSGLEADPQSLHRQVDWVAKLRLLEGMMERHDTDWSDPRCKMADLQYHDLRPEKCLAQKLGLEELVTLSDITEATSNPPRQTRAYFRGRFLEKFSQHVLSANWDSMVVDMGGDLLERVSLLDPTQGTSDKIDRLFSTCETPAELLAQMQDVLNQNTTKNM